MRRAVFLLCFLVPLIGMNSALAGDNLPLDRLISDAEAGKVDSMNALSAYYRDGNLESADYSKAFEWYLKAADKGDPAAQNEVGAFYKYGLGVKQDFTKAMVWYLKSAAQKNALAAFRIGTLYLEGDGVTKDLTKSTEWVLKYDQYINLDIHNHVLSATAIEEVKYERRQANEMSWKRLEIAEKLATMKCGHSRDNLEDLRPADAENFIECIEPIYKETMRPALICPDIYDAYWIRLHKDFQRFHDKEISFAQLLGEKSLADAEKDDDCAIRREMKDLVRIF